jgi:hypothetical protein
VKFQTAEEQFNSLMEFKASDSEIAQAEPDNAPIAEQLNDIQTTQNKLSAMLGVDHHKTPEPDNTPNTNNYPDFPPMEHAPPLTVLDGDDMAVNAKPPNYMINDIIETDAHGILFGASQSFKSFCALRLAYSVCTGEPFFYHEVFTTGKVLYICGEGKGALERRVRALFLSLGRFNGNLKYIADIVSIDTPESMARVKAVIAEYKPVLVILDTFSSLAFNTNENDNSEVAKALALIRNTCTNGFTSSFVVHHNGKNGALGERGASAFANNTDFRFELKREADTMITTLSCPKQKDGEPFALIHMKAEVIPLGIIRQDGKEATSLILKPCDDSEKPSKKTKAKLKPNEEKVLSRLSKALNNNGIEPTQAIKDLFTDSVHNIPLKVVNIDYWQPLAYECITTNSKPSATEKAKQHALYMAFNRIYPKLEQQGFIGLHGGYAWIAKR